MRLQRIGLSHSEIPGSKVICTYPRLIAAYHVLHRLREPRHPPCALNYFLFKYTHLPNVPGRKTGNKKRGGLIYTFSSFRFLLFVHHVKDRMSRNGRIEKKQYEPGNKSGE